MTISDAVVSQLDLMPTILELVKQPRANVIMQSLDGISLVPLLNIVNSKWPARELFWYYPG